MNYWLSRDETAAPEGPYSLSQLRTLVRGNWLGEAAMACKDGENQWRSLMSVLSDPDPVTAPPLNMDQVLRQRDRGLVKGCDMAIQVLCWLAVGLALIPAVGIFLALAVWVPVAIVCSLLAVVQMVKGSGVKGVVNILAAWIALPLVMFIGQAFSVGFFRGLPRPPSVEVSSNSGKPEEYRKSAAEAYVKENGPAYTGMYLTHIQEKNGPVVYANFITSQGRREWRVTFNQLDQITEVYSHRDGVLFEQK